MECQAAGDPPYLNPSHDFLSIFLIEENPPLLICCPRALSFQEVGSTQSIISKVLCLDFVSRQGIRNWGKKVILLLREKIFV